VSVTITHTQAGSAKDVVAEEFEKKDLEETHSRYTPNWTMQVLQKRYG
tara:strand:- start:2679 stop:2822 length:144 start_codon:yes stop_codon:yes gene_type:complete